MQQALALLNHWSPRRILVVGDFMLDRYVSGDVNRISPDAPVPVLSVASFEDEGVRNNPGGAGNVAAMLRALRCEVVCAGVTGDDGAAHLLRAALDADTSGLFAQPGRRTTVKFNIVGLAQHRHRQKLFRIDVEDREPIDAATESRLLDFIAAQLPRVDAVCLEDYAKGVVTPTLAQGVMARARAAGVPVLVDPANITDFSRYRGCACLKPNRGEALRATGETDIDTAASRLMAELDLEALVLTLDKQGAMLLERGQPVRRIPTEAREVYDVTGAGDAVLAMLAAARAQGANWPTAVDLANLTAGIEVERFGVAPVELHEVLLAALRRDGATVGKQRDPATLLVELAAHRTSGKKVVFTNGCFDILHAGHVAFLREARQQGDLLVVGLNSDDSIRRIKSDKDELRPVNPLADRLMVLSELASVDYIVVFDSDTPLELITAVQPDVLVKGSDYTVEQVVGHEAVQQRGGRVHLVQLVPGRSTTGILRRAREAHVP